MRRWLWGLGLVVALAAGDVLLWRYAERQLQAGLDQWLSAQRAAGWTIAMAGRQTGGWPLAATLAVRDVSIEGGRNALRQGLAWRSDRVVLRLSLLHPASLQIDASGAGRLRIAAGPEVGYSAGQLVVALPLRTSEPPEMLDLQAGGLAVDLPDRPVSIRTLTARVTMAPAAKQGEAAVAVALEAADIGLPAVMHWALGPRVASLALDAALDGPLPADGGVTQRATTWRNDGGALVVQMLETAWGPLRLHGTARLGLDAGLQPSGHGDARIAGYDATADALAAHGIMTPSAAVAVKAVLSLLAHAPDNGGPAEVDVPLMLRKRTLSMQSIPLLRMPELDWPGE